VNGCREQARIRGVAALAPAIALALVLAVLAGGAACGGKAAPATILVFAAASTADALTELGAAFTERTGIPVHFAFGASSDLARQLAAGAPGDVFLSADRSRMDELERIGLVRAGSRRNLLANELAVVVAADVPLAIEAPDDLLAVQRLALADPAAVPAGIYARTWLSTNGLWAALAPRVIPTQDVRAALAAVESGAAEAAIVYRTDAARASRTRLAFTVPRALGPPIIYPAAALTGSRHPAAAAEFVHFLASEEARTVFARLGFIPL
jgi:molybdate transport system substrate-binding protein